MKHRNVSAFVFSLLLLFQGHISPELLAQDLGGQPVLMTVGGKPIYKDDLVYLISKGNGEKSSPGISREEFEENLELFINYQLKVKEAEAQSLEKSEEFINEFASFKETLITPFLIQNSIEEGELRKAYGRMQEIIRASHVLFQFPSNASTEDSLIVLKMALKVKTELENGGNINDLAIQYSDDPSAKTNKGDLGFFTSLQMVQPFEDAAYSLQKDQVSAPVLTNFGYHIIQVKDRLPNPGQVRVSHILVRFDPTDATQEENARRKIADIYTEIQKESTVWEDIVKTYSEDPGTKDRGGLLPWFGVGNMIPEFEMAAFSLTDIGEVSPPLRTQYGYHILRLEAKKPLDTYEEMEESIRSRILRDSRSKMIQSQVVAIQKARYGFQENEASVNSLAQKLNQVAKSQFDSKINEENLGDSPLFTLQGKSYAAKDLAAYVGTQETLIRSNVPTFDFWYDRFVAKTLATAEQNDLEANNKAYQMLLKEYRDGILLFSLMNKEVWEKGISDSLGQVTYFREHHNEYQWQDRVEALIVKVLDSTQLVTARAALEGKGYNESVIESFRSQVEANHPLAFHTESGLYEVHSKDVLANLDSSKNFQEITFEGDTYLILTGQRIPAGPRKFEESRGLVIRDYQDYLDKTLLASLKTKYPVQIDPKVKEETYLALNQ